MPDETELIDYPEGFSMLCAADGTTRIIMEHPTDKGTYFGTEMTGHQLRRLGTEAMARAALMLSGTLGEDPAMDEPFLGGWAELGSSKKFHWYDGARRSLCGKWTAPFAPVAAFDHDITEVVSAECRGCRTKLDTQLTKLAKAEALRTRAKQLHAEAMAEHGHPWSERTWDGLVGVAKARYIRRAREQLRAEQERAEATG